MQFRYPTTFVLCALTVLFAPEAAADIPVKPGEVVSTIYDLFKNHSFNDSILAAAQRLFWALAGISLVWTMGMLIVRQDLGELLMELLRFIIVTGIFYWLLVNASEQDGGGGFVGDIVESFFVMLNEDTSDELIKSKANGILWQGLHVFYNAVYEIGEGAGSDQLLAGLMALLILIVCAVMASQFLVAMVTAWMLGYAGIFLLGFGGARWTSPIAINFYKHVVAVGASLLVITLIGKIGANFLQELSFDSNSRRGEQFSQFTYLGLMLAASILMMALSIKVPQLIHTLVTGSSLGLLAGSAGAAGSAIASAGSAAYAAAMGRTPGGGPSGGGGGAHRSESAMDAVQRSASAAGGMVDPFHVTTGSDPFGVPRRGDPHRGGGSSVFGGSSAGPSAATETLTRAAGRSTVDDTPWSAPAANEPRQPASTRGSTGAPRPAVAARESTLAGERQDNVRDAATFDALTPHGAVDGHPHGPLPDGRHGVPDDRDVGPTHTAAFDRATTLDTRRTMEDDIASTTHVDAATITRRDPGRETVVDTRETMTRGEAPATHLDAGTNPFIDTHGTPNRGKAPATHLGDATTTRHDVGEETAVGMHGTANGDMASTVRVDEGLAMDHKGSTDATIDTTMNAKNDLASRTRVDEHRSTSKGVRETTIRDTTDVAHGPQMPDMASDVTASSSTVSGLQTRIDRPPVQDHAVDGAHATPAIEVQHGQAKDGEASGPDAMASGVDRAIATPEHTERGSRDAMTMPVVEHGSSVSDRGTSSPASGHAIPRELDTGERARPEGEDDMPAQARAERADTSATPVHAGVDTTIQGDMTAAPSSTEVRISVDEGAAAKTADETAMRTLPAHEASSPHDDTPETKRARRIERGDQATREASAGDVTPAEDPS